MYFLCREFTGENASAFGAAIYVVAPYHVNEIYNAFTYAEFAAAAIIPFSFLFVKRVCRGGGALPVLGLAAAYACLVLTHLPITVIGSLGLLVFAIFSLRSTIAVASIARLASSVGLGFAASSFYWVRMVSELDLVKHSTQEFTSGSYDFHFNFLGSFFLLSSIDYDGTSLWFADLMFLVTLGLFLPGAVLFFLKYGKSGFRRLLGVSALLIFAIVISTPLSLPIWEHVAILRSTQFPWRALTLVTLCSAVFASIGYEQIGEAFRSAKRPLALVSIGLVTAGVSFSGFQVIRPAIFSSPQELNRTVANLSDAKSYTCWWPGWADESAFKNREKVSAGERSVEISDWRTLERTFSVGPGEPRDLRIATFYYPRWAAEVNGRSVPVSMEADGTILIPVTAEPASVRLFFEEPFAVRVANWVSILTWLFLSGFGIQLAVRRPDFP